MPLKIAGGRKIEMALLYFGRKASVRLNNEINKTLEKCNEFYKNIRQIHKKCNLSLVAKITDLPNKDQRMAHLQDKATRGCIVHVENGSCQCGRC